CASTGAALLAWLVVIPFLSATASSSAFSIGITTSQASSAAPVEAHATVRAIVVLLAPPRETNGATSGPSTKLHVPNNAEAVPAREPCRVRVRAAPLGWFIPKQHSISASTPSTRNAGPPASTVTSTTSAA